MRGGARNDLVWHSRPDDNSHFLHRLDRCSDGTLSSKAQNHGGQDCPPSVDNDKLDMTSAP